MTEPIILPLGDPSSKGQIILSIEESVKNLIDNIAHKGQSYTKTTKSGEVEVEFEQYENYPEVPSSQTGVVMHYVIKGIKEDMGIEFDETPKALKERKSPSGGGGMRFTKDMKNSILDRCNAGYYDESLGMDEIFNNIKTAMEEKKQWEDLGYVLIPEKTKPPMKKDSEKYNDYLATKEATQQARILNGKKLGAMAKS
tara:strand:- start:53 stop:646 length:594 start_codon:yes stop_codon:yes gene_type:complete